MHYKNRNGASHTNSRNEQTLRSNASEFGAQSHEIATRLYSPLRWAVPEGIIA